MSAETSLTTLSEIIGLPLWLLLIISAWSLLWKGLALWKAAKKDHSIWFAVFLLIHTIGILEILYIFLISDFKERLKKEKKGKVKIKKRKIPAL